MKLLRNPLAVATLAAAALGVVVWNLGRPVWNRYYARFTAAPAAPRASTRVTPSVPSAQADHLSSESHLPIDVAVIQVRMTEWLESPLRDPFEAYLGGISSPSGPRAADLLSLRAVWRQTGHRLAVINEIVVGEGDQILGFRIDRIEGDVVWVHGTNGTERIEFPDPTGKGAGNAPNPAKRTSARKRAATT